MNAEQVLFNLFFWNILAKIPKTEAAVQSTVLVNMFGKATPDIIDKL